MTKEGDQRGAALSDDEIRSAFVESIRQLVEHIVQTDALVGLELDRREKLSPEASLAELQSEYTYLDDMCKKQVQRIEDHLIRIRDKHLAQFRLHKKDRADEGEETRKAKPSRHFASDAATIPVAVQPDPIVDATSPGGTLAAESASGSPEELARRQAIREETEKFREYLSTRRYGFSEAQISQEIQDHLIEIGLVVDSPHVEVN